MDKGILTTFFRDNFPIPSQRLALIADHFELKTYKKNDYFLEEGKVSNQYLFLEQGFMRAFTFDLDGNEVTTYFYPENQVVFEVSSFFLRTPSTENIQALTDSRGYAITFDQLNMLFHAYPEFREFGRAMLVKQYAAFKQRTLALINKSAEERYAQLMSGNKEIFQYAQLKHIASYLGIADTSLSRIRREYSKKR
jgi:CRP-like cAMP-binding protein